MVNKGFDGVHEHNVSIPHCKYIMEVNKFVRGKSEFVPPKRSPPSKLNEYCQMVRH